MEGNIFEYLTKTIVTFFLKRGFMYLFIIFKFILEFRLWVLHFFLSLFDHKCKSFRLFIESFFSPYNLDHFPSVFSNLVLKFVFFFYFQNGIGSNNVVTLKGIRRIQKILYGVTYKQVQMFTLDQQGGASIPCSTAHFFKTNVCFHRPRPYRTTWPIVRFCEKKAI